MTQEEHEIITPSDASEDTAKKFNAMVAEDGWPAETEDGQLIRIVSKDASPSGHVLNDADGGRWVEAGLGKVKPADDADVVEPVDEYAAAKEKELADAQTTTPTESTTMTPSEARTALTTTEPPVEVEQTEPPAEQTDEAEQTEPPAEQTDEVEQTDAEPLENGTETA
jgi:hypothetical protein